MVEVKHPAVRIDIQGTCGQPSSSSVHATKRKQTPKTFPPHWLAAPAQAKSPAICSVHTTRDKISKNICMSAKASSYPPATFSRVPLPFRLSSFGKTEHPMPPRHRGGVSRTHPMPSVTPSRKFSDGQNGTPRTVGTTSCKAGLLQCGGGGGAGGCKERFAPIDGRPQWSQRNRRFNAAFTQDEITSK